MKHTSIVFGLFTVIALGSCQKEIQKRADANATANNVLAKVDAGDVYTISNAITDNQVFHYDRAPDGTLTLEGKYSTNGGGTGSHFPLGSQGAVMLSDDKNWLFVVNARTNEISSFSVNAAGLLQLVDKVSSHGLIPISIAVHGSSLYVLNAGADFKGSIAGYHINANGKLTYIQNSAIALNNSTVKPAQISFNPGGTALIITEKTVNKIISFTVDATGLARNMQTTSSAGIEPFGFAVGQSGNIYISEAFNGLLGKSTVSSYHVNNAGTTRVVDALEKNHQTASCWVVITNDEKYIYAANTGSGTITGYGVNNGKIALLNADGITAKAGTAPIDEALSSDSKYLYVINSGDLTIGAYSVNAQNGALAKIGQVEGLHFHSAGLAAR